MYNTAQSMPLAFTVKGNFRTAGRNSMLYCTVLLFGVMYTTDARHPRVNQIQQPGPLICTYVLYSNVSPSPEYDLSGVEREGAAHGQAGQQPHLPPGTVQGQGS